MNRAFRVIEGVQTNAAYTFTACDGDMDGNHLVEMADVLLFVEAFVARERRADLDASGVHNIFDLFAFLDAFGAGCSEDW